MLSHFSHVWLFAIPWTAAHQAPLSMGILQVRIPKWIAMPSSRGSSRPRDRIHVSYVSCIGRLVLFFFFPFIFISWRLITLQYCSGFCHTLTWMSHGFTCIPHSDPLPHLLSTPSLWVFPVHQGRALISYMQPGLVICFTFDNIHVSMLFSQNIPPSPSPTESKSLFCTSMSIFLFCILGYHYHLSKFHIYALVYCIGFLSFWLTSLCIMGSSFIHH